LVEDDSANYEVLSDHLASTGYEVHGASDGRDALEVARRVRPDVVITDFDIPGMNGCELARSIRDEHEIAHSRIILLTGHAQNGVQELARSAGCDAVIRKPVHLDDLVYEVRRVLSTPKWILIVDDDESVRETLSEALMERGFIVAVASNGLDALDWLQENEAPDAILLDLMMPIMDGWDFLAEQRRDPRLAAIPVIVITATKGARVPHQSAPLLEKPITLQRLFTALDATRAAR
jgi:CheY-like chemotaxis protein